jgi:voltage-gated sodium channel
MRQQHATQPDLLPRQQPLLPGIPGLLISERVVMSIITLNAIVLFADAFPQINAAAGRWLMVLDYSCIVYFVLEVILKWRALGWVRYISSGWNSFDFTIVALSTPALLVPFGMVTEGWGAILLLRLIRLSRFLRMLRFSPRLERLLAGAQRALRASLGILIATVFYLFIFGVAATYLFGHPDSPAHEKFSDPIISMYTMFTVFTIEGWFETPDLIAAEQRYWAAHAVRGFFVLAVISGGIILLSLLNAVFVEEMSSDLSEQQEKDFDEVDSALRELRDELRQRLDAIERKLDERIGGGGS